MAFWGKLVSAFPGSHFSHHKEPCTYICRSELRRGHGFGVGSTRQGSLLSKKKGFAPYHLARWIPHPTGKGGINGRCEQSVLTVGLARRQSPCHPVPCTPGLITARSTCKQTHIHTSHKSYVDLMCHSDWLGYMET